MPTSYLLLDRSRVHRRRREKRIRQGGGFRLLISPGLGGRRSISRCLKRKEGVFGGAKEVPFPYGAKGEKKVKRIQPAAAQ